MDRLVCGDVGFGKTEVALRAAFVAAMNGFQVAIVVPTTLLARQHTRTVIERFKNLPLRVAQASRLVGNKDLAEVKDGLKKGTIDIVVGTHALLGKSIEFQRLGLLVIDEEQHFGVTHKERLKQLPREDVHVLTLVGHADPAHAAARSPGVRELSSITHAAGRPPAPCARTSRAFDPVILVDALKRERDRGGQTSTSPPHLRFGRGGRVPARGGAAISRWRRPTASLHRPSSKTS